MINKSKYEAKNRPLTSTAVQSKAKKITINIMTPKHTRNFQKSYPYIIDSLQQESVSDSSLEMGVFQVEHYILTRSALAKRCLGP